MGFLSCPCPPPYPTVTTHVLRAPRPEAASSHQNGGGGRDRREEGKTQGLPVPPPLALTPWVQGWVPWRGGWQLRLTDLPCPS